MWECQGQALDLYRITATTSVLLHNEGMFVMGPAPYCFEAEYLITFILDCSSS